MVNAGAEIRSEYGSSISLEARFVALNTIESVIGQLETHTSTHRLCIDTFRPFGEALGIGAYVYMLDQTAAKITRRGIVRKELSKDGDGRRNYYYVKPEGLTVLTLMGYEIAQDTIAGRLKLHGSISKTYFQLQAWDIKHWFREVNRPDLAKSIHENTQGIKLLALSVRSPIISHPPESSPHEQLDHTRSLPEKVETKKPLPVLESEPEDLKSRLLAFYQTIKKMEFPPEERLSDQEKKDIRMGLLLARIMDETGCYIQEAAKVLNIDPIRANNLVNKLQDRTDHLELTGLPLSSRRRPTKYSTYKKAV